MESVKLADGVTTTVAGKIGRASEPFPLKLHSRLLEGVFMVGILFSDRKERS